MKYKIIGKNDTYHPLEQVLKNRGIKDIETYLHIKKEVVIRWNKLKNINRAIECYIHHLKKDSKIFVQIDSDP